MKKNILNTLMWSLTFVASIGITSCDNDDTIDRNYGVNNDEVYFPTTLPQTVELAFDATSFDVEVCRVRTADNITVPIVATDESGLFQIPNSVTFAAGASKATLTIGYSLDDINYGDFKTIVLKIADESLTSPYGLTSYTFSAGINEPWSSLGKGRFSDVFLFENTYDVEIQQNDVDPTVFRLVNPYAQGIKAEGFTSQAGPSEYVQFRILQPGEKVYDTTVTMENLVFFDTFYTGFYHTSYDDEVKCYWPGRFTKYSDESFWTHNLVLSYQEDGTPAVVQFAPFYYMDNAGGWDYTQKDGMIIIVFPGVTLLDSSIEVTHTGFFTDVNDNKYVVADITLGSDVSEAKVALVQGNDGEAGVNDILGGIVESISLTSSGEIKIPIPEDAEDGKYSVVAISFIDGEAKEYDYATFTYTAGTKEQWNQIAIGTYTYSLFFKGDDTDLSLCQSQEDPTRYKIENWGYGVDFIFTMDENGTIIVNDQETGYVHPDYGAVYVDDLVDYTGTTDYGVSSYANDVFTFNVVYYVGAGEFGYGPETFTITSKSNDSASRSRSIKSKKVFGSALNKVTFIKDKMLTQPLK